MFPSRFRPLARQALGLFLVSLLATQTSADELGFPASSFGQLLLVPDQTTGGNKALLAAQEGGAFEPLSEFNPDDRYRLFGAPIARLDMLIVDSEGTKSFGTCTANLIAPDVLLTNYHCIPGYSTEDRVIRSIAVFDFLREDQEDAPTFEVDVTPIAADPDLDFALLRVDGRPGDQFGYFQLQPKQAKPNQSLFLIHHPAGMPKRLTRFRCKAYAPEPYARTDFRHRCDTLGGSSGSLIFNLDFEVIALHNKGGLNDSSTTSFNRGISIFALMENAAFAKYLKTPEPDKPVLNSGPLRPLSDLLSDQAKADLAAKAQDPAALPKNFSLYNPKTYANEEVPARLSRTDGPPLPADPRCDTLRGWRICASSYLNPQKSGKYTYRMANLANDDGLAWVENNEGQGVGEWLVFDFNKPKEISRIIFRNGYTRTAKTFATNSRVSELKIELSNGSTYQIGLSDMSDLQQFTLPEPETAKWVKITINSVFKGSKYADTALSFVEFR